MSLWVYLEKEITEDHINTCEYCGAEHKCNGSRYEQYYDRNITHNLTKMADEADIYYAIWRPEERGYERAKDIIPLLERGVNKMKERPDYYRQFNASNGWGVYEDFLPWVEEYLAACKEWPEATIRVSR